MQERHENEQYFFSAETTSQLASFAAQFPNPCCICAPSIGKALTQRGVGVRILDIDERFADLPGFRHFDLRRPDWLDEEFGIIICDPPFFNLSLSRLFAALRLLSVLLALFVHHDFTLERDGDRLGAGGGLLTHAHGSARIDRLQMLHVDESLLHRLFTRMSLKTEVAGGVRAVNDQSGKLHWLAPIASPPT